jgi:hypothetical protein
MPPGSAPPRPNSGPRPVPPPCRCPYVGHVTRVARPLLSPFSLASGASGEASPYPGPTRAHRQAEARASTASRAATSPPSRASGSAPHGYRPELPFGRGVRHAMVRRREFPDAAICNAANVSRTSAASSAASSADRLCANRRALARRREVAGDSDAWSR